MASATINNPDVVPSDYSTALGTLQILLELKAEGRTSSDDKGLLRQVARHFSQHAKLGPRNRLCLINDLSAATKGLRGLLDFTGCRPTYLDVEGQVGWVLRMSSKNIVIEDETDDGGYDFFNGGTRVFEYTHVLGNGTRHFHRVVCTHEKSMGVWMWIGFGRGYKNGIYHFSSCRHPWNEDHNDWMPEADGFMLGYKPVLTEQPHVYTDVGHRALAVFRNDQTPGKYTIVDYEMEHRHYVVREHRAQRSGKIRAMWMRKPQPGDEEVNNNSLHFSPDKVVDPDMWLMANNGVWTHHAPAKRLIRMGYFANGCAMVPESKLVQLEDSRKRKRKKVFYLWAQDNQEEQAECAVKRCARAAVASVKSQLALEMVGNEFKRQRQA